MIRIDRLRPTLPSPSKERWEPLRAGIVNIWQFSDQEFWFHAGRLILQGRNQAGKTKALEILFPFLFDANLDANRLNPIGGDSRPMIWNLLEIGRDGVALHKSRECFAWLEFGRRTTDGSMVFTTIGVRMRATDATRKVTASFFLTDQRIGEDLSLVTETPDPAGGPPIKRVLSRERLEDLIGDHGGVWDQRAAYRKAVDERLFHLGARYDALVTLLITLRRPKLSEKLDLEAVRRHLTEALPPLDQGRVAEQAAAFMGLREDQLALASAQRSADQVRSFMEVYREYALRTARSFADQLRAAEERVRTSAETAREQETGLAAATAEAERLLVLADSLGQERINFEERINAHRASPAMREAERLAEASRAAADAERRATEREAEAGRVESRAERERTRAERAEAEVVSTTGTLETAQAKAAASSALASLVPAHAAFIGRLGSDPAGAESMIERAIVARRKVLRALDDQVSALHVSRGALARAESDLAEAVTRVATAQAEREAAETALAKSRDDLASSLLAWAIGLEELDVDDPVVEALLEVADAGGSIEAAVRERAVAPRGDLVAGRSTLQNQLVAVERDLAEAQAERAAIEAAPVARPPAPVGRADRTGRAGAPFYEVIDFAPDTSPADQAGIECALQGSGLLDAWILPDGRLLDAEVLDAAMNGETAGRPVAGTTVASMLVPAISDTARIAEPVIRRLLGAIALGEVADAPAWVTTDGRFGIGPLVGRSAKAEPEFVGAGARAETRRRRLAEVDARIVAIESTVERLTGEVEAHQARIARLDEEVAAVPPTQEYIRARDALGLRLRHEETVTAEHDRMAKRVEALAAEVKTLDDALKVALRAAGITGAIDLANARDAITEYQADVGRVIAGFARNRAAISTRDERVAEAREVELQASTVAEQARTERGAASAASSFADELSATRGPDAAAAVARLETLQAASRKVDEDLTQARADREVAVRASVRHEADLDVAKAAVSAAETSRAEQVEAWKHLGVIGLLGLVGIGTGESPATWNIRRSLEVARTVNTSEPQGFNEAAVNQASDAVNRRYRELEREIGTEYALDITTVEDGVLTIDAQRGDTRLSIAGLADTLDQEVLERTQLLDRKTRELLTRYLLTGVGEELGERIREAQTLVRAMNAELALTEMASGKRLHLNWDVSPNAPDGAAHATRLLLLDPATLNDADRESLITYLGGRVDAAREDELADGFVTALENALDYRDWFHFDLEEVTPTGRHRLTRKSHASGSGGEQSVTLHLPLFAAVAAYYAASPRAPRLFFLDEAFSGIDHAMRGSLMGFLVKYDLDFVITSPDEWGTYAQLNGTAIYHLARDRDDGVRGVLARRFVWDGEQLLDEKALAALDAAVPVTLAVGVGS